MSKTEAEIRREERLAIAELLRPLATDRVEPKRFRINQIITELEAEPGKAGATRMGDVDDPGGLPPVRWAAKLVFEI